MPWTSVYPAMLDSTKFAAGFAAPQGITQRAQRGTRILSTAPAKMTFEDIKKWKLSTHVETADQFVDEIVATRESVGTDRAKRAADVLAKWDREAEVTSDGTLLFYQVHVGGRAETSQSIGGFKVPTDDRRPLETPRGFTDPARAMAALDKVAGEVEKEYGSLSVKWGDVLRFRRGNADCARQRRAVTTRRHPHDRPSAVRERQGAKRCRATPSTRSSNTRRRSAPKCCSTMATGRRRGRSTSRISCRWRRGKRCGRCGG